MYLILGFVSFVENLVLILLVGFNSVYCMGIINSYSFFLRERLVCIFRGYELFTFLINILRIVNLYFYL